MSEVKITYRGWPGHFCAAYQCEFRLNTLIEYKDKKIIVSTVGRYRSDHTSNYKEVGFGRYYETMAFWSDYEPPFYDANVEEEIDFSSPWYVSKIEDELKANKMHEDVVKELSMKIKD